MRTILISVVTLSLLFYTASTYAIDKFTPLSQILNEANANKDEVAYIYVLERCGAIMGSVAGYESNDNRADAKKIVKINNEGAEFFITTALNASVKLKQQRKVLINDIQDMIVVYVDNFKKNRLLNANIFTGFVEQDYKICVDLYKQGTQK